MKARKYKATKYVFFCDKCEMWYDRNEILETCTCGEKLRKLDGEELNEFYCKLAHSGYRIIPYAKKN
ncbi:MAG: hypothetical protein Q4A32_09665 [Lachnospiraceae bacterium]|nr:hypothetical protein [Lachnospiraceae bacterium]